MSIRSAYTDWAATYDSDRNLTRDLDQLVTRTVLGSRHFTSILELGCGTGKNTELLTQIGDHVYAADFSEGMLAQAKAKLHHDNLRFAVADLTQSWPYADQGMNLIVCNLVLEHIADLAFIFSEARRVLKERGHFFICELHPAKQYGGKKATFQHGGQQTEIPAFVHHISNYLDAAERAGFTLNSLKEWWHEAEQQIPPRLVSFMFEK
jgi:ubiquinone/menaquinone biosynthesis C-methylase UbiE